MTTPSPMASAPSPFEHNHADPWAKTFIDLPELNAGATDAIATAVATVRAAARRGDVELRTASLLVLGPAGAGKTHLFARLRHKFGPKAVFVHLRPLVGTEMTPRYVLGQIVQQLGYETSTPDSGLKQLEALVGSSLAQLEGESPDWPRTFLDDVAGLDEATRAEKLESALERLLARYQEADETYLARLLEAPFMKSTHQRAALAWLAGRELEEVQMKRLGVSGSLPEERIVQALQTLGLFAAPGAPIVLVFDQLENLMDAGGTGARVRSYANLVAELFDATRGYVLVQMALDSEWEKAIRPQLSEAQKSRLGGHVTAMALPTPTQSREAVRRWVEQLPPPTKPFPWPFGEQRVEHWARTVGLTPRMLMIECRQALALGPDAPFVEPDEPAPMTERAPVEVDGDDDDAALGAAWEGHLEAARKALDEAAADRRSADPARLVGGVAGVLRFLKDAQTSRVDARQPVQLVARVGESACFVTFLHQTSPKSLGAALERAAEGLAKGRVVLIRERAREFPPTWKKTQAILGAIVGRGAIGLTLERDDTARLLALETFLAASRSRDLEDGRGRIVEDAEVERWLARVVDVAGWPIAQAVAGSTQVDADALGSRLDSSTPDRAPVQPVLQPRAGAAQGAAISAGDTAATIRAVLVQLRVASLERLVREVSRVRPTVSRAEVLEVLQSVALGVRWFGRAIVAVVEQKDGAP